jgi:hypothetical protein
MQAAWKVIAFNRVWTGYPYYASTFFKFDATWVFPGTVNFESAFTSHYISQYAPDSSYMNIMPVWQTSGITPYRPDGTLAPYGSEQEMYNAVYYYSYKPYTVGLEFNQKQVGGILQTIVLNIFDSSDLASANFNPYAEYIDPNDGYGTYQFFYSNGYCCGRPRDWFYNGSPFGQPSDTDDLRTQWGFLLDSGLGFNLITTDNVLPMRQYLVNEGRRNTSYYY